MCKPWWQETQTAGESPAVSAARRGASPAAFALASAVDGGLRLILYSVVATRSDTKVVRADATVTIARVTAR